MGWQRRDGRLNDPRYGSRLHGEGIWADLLHQVFTLACRQAGLHQGSPALSTAAFRRPGERTLFDDVP